MSALQLHDYGRHVIIAYQSLPVFSCCCCHRSAVVRAAAGSDNKECAQLLVLLVPA